MSEQNLTPGPFDLGDRINAHGAHYQIVSLATPDELGNRPATSLLASSLDDAFRVTRLLNAEMTMERAEAINADCCQTVLSRMVTGKHVPLPTDYTLEEMLTASKMIADSPGKLNAEGKRTFTTYCDPRILALHYAFDHYDSSPLELLEALGFNLDQESVGFCQGCGTFIASILLRAFDDVSVCVTCHNRLKQIAA